MMSAVAGKTQLGSPSGPGAFSGDVDLIASKVSFSTIGARLISAAFCTPCMSCRSATGGLRKKVRPKTPAFPLASAHF